MLPTLPIICGNLIIHLPTFHFSLIIHAFAEQRLGYQMIKILNANGLQPVILKAQFFFFIAFIKYCIIDMYVYGCYNASCVI